MDVVLVLAGLIIGIGIRMCGDFLHGELTIVGNKLHYVSISVRYGYGVCVDLFPPWLVLPLSSNFLLDWFASAQVTEKIQGFGSAESFPIFMPVEVEYTMKSFKILMPAVRVNSDFGCGSTIIRPK